MRNLADTTPADAAVAAFAPAAGVEDALAFTRQLTRGHYENFSVVSRLLPQRLRQDFCNIYAFCRLADDLGDEIHEPGEALRQLERFREDLRACYNGASHAMVFVALRQSIDLHQIPIEPFLQLIDAFEQDQRVTRYDTFEQLLDYCRRSANPVGRLVLYVCGYRDEERQRLSDLTCSALQLANFWQDVRRDLHELNRIYLPRETMDRFGISEQQLLDGRVDENFRDMIRFEVDRTESMFAQGDALLPLLDPSVRRHIALFGLGGRAVLESIRKQNYDTLTSRPSLSAWQKSRLIARAAGGQLWAAITRRTRL